MGCIWEIEVPKIIIVSGVGNTGKSTSIKTAMNNLGVYVGRPSGDVLLSAHLHISGRGYSVGFASGGDSPGIVTDNINFFRPLGLDCMVFACRSYGAGLAALNAFAATLGVSPIMILTAPSPNPPAANAATVTAILSNIP